MGFNDELNKITNDLLGVFFPRKCPFCGRGVDRKSLLCQPCSDTLPRCGRVRQGADFGRCAAPLAACAAYWLAILEGTRQLGGMSGDISGFGLTLAELAGAAVLCLWG